jgi:hypothetical protein
LVSEAEILEKERDRGKEQKLAVQTDDGNLQKNR